MSQRQQENNNNNNSNNNNYNISDGPWTSRRTDVGKMTRCQKVSNLIVSLKRFEKMKKSENCHNNERKDNKSTKNNNNNNNNNFTGGLTSPPPLAWTMPSRLF